MSKINIKLKVKDLLEKYPSLRDNAIVLTLAYYKEVHGLSEDTPFNQIIYRIMKGEIPKSATIERLSRLIQKNNPDLQGIERQDRLDQEPLVIEDLGYSVSNYQFFVSGKKL